MRMIYHFLFWCLIASPLRGVCFGSQEDELKRYDELVKELAEAKTEGDYVRAADRITGHTTVLRTSFGSKNLAEMKRECGPSFTGSMQKLTEDFIRGPLLPENADAGIRKKALDLLKSLLATRIITIDSPKDARVAASALLDKGVWEALELLYSSAALVPKITTTDEQKALFDTVFLPLILQYGPIFAVKSPAAPGYEQFKRVIQTLLDYHTPLKTLQDDAGKTAIQRLFEKDLGRSVVQPQKIKSDKYLRELTSLKPLEGLKKVPVIRSLQANAQAAEWIVGLGHAVGTSRDKENNTFLHALRKNNTFGAQDADVRDLLDQAFGVVDFPTGFSKFNFAHILDKEDKRYTDYPPLVDPAVYNAYLDLYTAHAMGQFAESLNALI